MVAEPPVKPPLRMQLISVTDTRVYSVVPVTGVVNTSKAIPLVTLQAHAFVTQALIPANGTQVLYIITQDQNFAPVPGVSAKVTVTLPDGQTVVYHPSLTNSDGITQLTFSLKGIPVKDVVQVEVDTEYMSFQAQTSTWFRIWW